MNLRLAALLLLAATGGLSTGAQACTPTAQQTTAVQRLQYAEDVARETSSPQLARLAGQAADIFVAHVTRTDPAPFSDIPETFRREGQPTRPELSPVRYIFGIDRVLKGAPGPTVAFKATGQMASELTTKAWMVPASEGISWAMPRDTREFWHETRFAPAESEGGPGDCSSQWSYRTGVSYLIARDAEGGFLVAVPLTQNDSLPALFEQLIADPIEPFPYRPDLRTYLGLKGMVLRIALTRCGEGAKAKVLEVLHLDDSHSAPPEVGEVVELYALVPSLTLGPCRIGTHYIMDGWSSRRLHLIDRELVTFEDRWMQLRLSGDKRMPLTELRALFASSPKQ